MVTSGTIKVVGIHIMEGTKFYNQSVKIQTCTLEFSMKSSQKEGEWKCFIQLQDFL